ncbi:MAG: hypothetical protein Q7U04_09480 [Bacteriovorax sp.]|nr:hypothetical protein [Bacteriovorax sp.]
MKFQLILILSIFSTSSYSMENVKPTSSASEVSVADFNSLFSTIIYEKVLSYLSAFLG